MNREYELASIEPYDELDSVVVTFTRDGVRRVFFHGGTIVVSFNKQGDISEVEFIEASRVDRQRLTREVGLLNAKNRARLEFSLDAVSP